MSGFPEGDAIVWCQGAFGTPNGKPAHGLVRRPRRYRVQAVRDAAHAGADAGERLDGRSAGIAIHADLKGAMAAARERGRPATHLVIGLAPDGGRLPAAARADVREGPPRRRSHSNSKFDYRTISLRRFVEYCECVVQVSKPEKR
jgi:hypothetical protein